MLVRALCKFLKYLDWIYQIYESLLQIPKKSVLLLSKFKEWKILAQENVDFMIRICSNASFRNDAENAAKKTALRKSLTQTKR